jgi:hypothetical protein
MKIVIQNYWLGGTDLPSPGINRRVDDCNFTDCPVGKNRSEALPKIIDLTVADKQRFSFTEIKDNTNIFGYV